jgi:hypothetical protein
VFSISSCLPPHGLIFYVYIIGAWRGWKFFHQEMLNVWPCATVCWMYALKPPLVPIRRKGPLSPPYFHMPAAGHSSSSSCDFTVLQWWQLSISSWSAYWSLTFQNISTPEKLQNQKMHPN